MVLFFSKNFEFHIKNYSIITYPNLKYSNLGTRDVSREREYMSLLYTDLGCFKDAENFSLLFPIMNFSFIYLGSAELF